MEEVPQDKETKTELTKPNWSVELENVLVLSPHPSAFRLSQVSAQQNSAERVVDNNTETNYLTQNCPRISIKEQDRTLINSASFNYIIRSTVNQVIS